MWEALISGCHCHIFPIKASPYTLYTHTSTLSLSILLPAPPLFLTAAAAAAVAAQSLMAKTAAAVALLVAALVLVGIPATTDAQAPAEAPGAFLMPPVEGPSAFPMAPSSDDCLNNLLNMSDCLDYVQAGSNLTKPDKGCCPELAGLVESHPICLCQLLSNPEKIIGVSIELNKALKLPSVCKIDTPPASLCSGNFFYLVHYAY